jgi:hypothetical protein
MSQTVRLKERQEARKTRGQRPEASRAEARGKRQEARGRRQEGRGKRQEARGKRQEARGKRHGLAKLLSPQRVKGYRK